MSNIKVKLFVISTTLIFTMGILTGCNINQVKPNIDNSDNEIKNIDIEINKENGQVLEIESPKTEEETKSENQHVDTKTRIKNNSNFTIRDINLVYKEYNDSNKAVSTTDSFIELTLEPNEIAIIHTSHKKYIKNVEVIKYSYIVGNKIVYVDLESGKVNIKNTNEKIEKSKNYDILAISEPQKLNNVKGGFNSKLVVKNISKNDIGSVSIIIGELNEKNEYIGITYLDSFEVMKNSQDIEFNSVHSNNVKKIEVLGYKYDDVVENRTIDINYKLLQANILKN